MKSRLPVTLGLLVMCSLLVSGCGTEEAATVEAPTSVAASEAPTSAASPEAPPEPVVLRVGQTFEPDTLHPFLTATGWRFLDLIYEGFVGYGLECEEEYRLAESIEVSEDGLTTTIHLRPGITYNDGQVFDAHVLARSWDWITSVEVAGWFPVFWGLESYEAVDELTFRFTTSAPAASFLTYDGIYLWPFAPHIWGTLDDTTLWEFDNNTSPVGTGPYTLTEWMPGVHLIFDARPDYYLGEPPIDRVVITLYANWDAEISALLAGEIDITENSVPAQYYDVLHGAPEVTLLELPPAYYYLLAFNVSEGGNRHPAIGDPRVREAIDYALDRQQLVEIALMGHGITCPNYPNCGPIYSWANDPSITETPYDPGRASELLDEAGYLDSDTDGIRETPDGEPLAFRLYVPADRATAITMAGQIRDYLSAIGIATSIEAMERGTLETVAADEHDFDMIIRFDTTDPDPTTMDFWLSCWSSEGGAGNVSGYCNPEFDNLLYGQLSAASTEERLQMVFEAQRILAQDRPFITMVGETTFQAYRSDRFTFPDNACPMYGGTWNWAPLLQAEPVQ